jgi:hypothetical protein
VGGEELSALRSKIIIVGVDDWDGFFLKEAVDSFVEHMGGVVAQDGLYLHM